MPIQPVDLILVAKGIASSGLGEAGDRSATSRAYYGVLHHCLEVMPSKFVPAKAALKREGSHRAVIEAMESWGRARGAGSTDAQQAARKLTQLKRRRVCSHLHMGFACKWKAATCIADAERIMTLASAARAARDKATSPPET